MTGKSLARAGEHEARIVHVVRAGDHTPPNDIYNKGSTPRLWITYELLDDQNDDGNNRWISGFNYGQPINDYGGDMGKRNQLMLALGFLGNKDEDLKKLVGMQVWVDVEHSTNPKTGITYANFAGVAKTRGRDGEFPPLQNEAVYFDVKDPDPVAWNNLPKWIKDYILEADNAEELGVKDIADEAYKVWKESQDESNGASPSSNEASSEGGAASSGTVDDQGDDEDIPF
jgi:hypothetical protein